MELKATFMSRKDLKEKPFEKFSEAARAILGAVQEEVNKGGMSFQVLKQCIWIEAVFGGKTYIMKFYCIRDFAYAIGLLKSKEEGGEGFNFADEGEFIEPNDTLLKYAFTFSMADAMQEDFRDGASTFMTDLEVVINSMKEAGVRISQ